MTAIRPSVVPFLLIVATYTIAYGISVSEFVAATDSVVASTLYFIFYRCFYSMLFNASGAASIAIIATCTVRLN